MLLLSAVVIAACDQSPPPQPPVPEDVRLGFVFSTDANNSVSAMGQKIAAQMAVDEINAAGKGPRLTPIFRATVGSPEQAVAAFQTLITDDKVQAVFGPTLSLEARSAHPVAQKAGVPVLAVSNPAGGITDVGDYIFRVSLPDILVIPTTIQVAKDKLKISEVCLLYAPDDAFSRSEADVFRAELDRKGVKVLGEFTFGAADTDFELQLGAIKDLKPDAIMVSALAGPAAAILSQARTDVGIGSDVYIIGGYGFTAPQIVANPTSAEGLVVGEVWSPASTNEMSVKFVQAYERATGALPDQLATQAYAGVYIAYDAIVRANVKGKTLTEARTAIRDNLRGVSNLPTVLGQFSFTDKRDAKHLPVVQVFRNGRFEVVK